MGWGIKIPKIKAPSIGSVTGGLTGAGGIGSAIGGSAGKFLGPYSNIAGQISGGMVGGFPAQGIGGAVGSLPFNIGKDGGGGGGPGSGNFYNGRPTIPGFESQLNPDGTIKDTYQYSDPGGRVGLDALRTEATRTGPSKWAQLQRTSQLDDISQAADGNLSQGMNRTAMMGGLQSGAGERMAGRNMRDKLLAQQGALGGIAQADEENRLNALSSLPGAEIQDATFNRQGQQFNIQNALNEIANKRNYDMSKYKEDMAGYGAERTAAAAPRESGFKLFDPKSWF